MPLFMGIVVVLVLVVEVLVLVLVLVGTVLETSLLFEQVRWTDAGQ